jgi:adenosylcobinamide kinase/adenosylcobinamide-phosphate guanylyltransferase
MAAKLGTRVLYAATATGDDEEMRQRIALHRQARPASWRTLEEPLDLPRAISGEARDAEVVLIDCLTLWVSNLLIARGGEAAGASTEAAILDEVAQLVSVFRQGKATFVVIANEVGLGLVPPYPLGRLYRDALGRANQLLAAAADEVYFLVAGIPMTLKRREAV